MNSQKVAVMPVRGAIGAEPSLWLLRCLLLLASLVLVVPAGNAQTLLLRGAAIETSGPQGRLEIGDILIRDDRILAVAEDLSEHPGYRSARAIDFYGKVITPGFVLPWSPIGLVGMPLREAIDHAEGLGAGFDVSKVWIPRTSSVANALGQGVTAAQITPRKPADLFSGTGAVIAISKDTSRRDPLSSSNVVVARLDAFGDRPQVGVQELERVLDDVARYQSNRLTIERGGFYDFDVTRQDLRVLRRVVEGEIPLFVTAYGREEIRLLVDMAQRRNIRLILGGGSEIGALAESLADNGIPVVLNLASTPELGVRLPPLQAWKAAKRLHDAGVTVLFGSDSPDAPIEVRLIAGLAVAWGLPREAALRALTVNAARVLGLPDRGQILPGKIADLVIWSGDPIEMTSQVEAVMLSGQLDQEISFP